MIAERITFSFHCLTFKLLPTTPVAMMIPGADFELMMDADLVTGYN